MAGQPVLMRDVAYVRDGGPPQINIVRADGQQAVLMQILKNGTASTLDVVNNVKAALPTIRAAAPDGHDDQAAVRPVGLRLGRHRGRAARGASSRPALTGLTILLFLGLLALDAHRADLDPALRS